MSDTLKTRVGRIIAGSVNALLDHLEDQQPEAMMAQSLRELDTLLDDVRHELGKTSANLHLARQQHARLNQQHQTLAEHIEHALAEGRDDLAQAAIARQIDIEAQLPVMDTSLAELHAGEQALAGYVAALQGKKRELADTLQAYQLSRKQAAAPASASTEPGIAHRLEQVARGFENVYQRQTGLSLNSAQASLQQSNQLQTLENLVREQQIAQRLASIKAGKA
ncbi:MAG: PspA/IM30 family protein [Vogesella sp.]|nr:PspA/IM30 family protein [Vogesella sp.]